MNMRFWLEALAEPKRMAAQVLTTNPIKVRTLGLMRERASQRTMVSSRTPQARPKALVQLGLIRMFPGLLCVRNQEKCARNLSLRRKCGGAQDDATYLRLGASRLAGQTFTLLPSPVRSRRGWCSG